MRGNNTQMSCGIFGLNAAITRLICEQIGQPFAIEQLREDFQLDEGVSHEFI
jgi:hypothetical protein